MTVLVMLALQAIFNGETIMEDSFAVPEKNVSGLCNINFFKMLIL